MNSDNNLMETRILKMQFLYIIIIICGLFCIPTINCNPTCPTGKPTTNNSYCGTDKPCPSGSICYHKNNENFCCGEVDKFCSTKMHAINSEESGSYSWGPVDPTDTRWYNVELGNETISCPFPYSFAYKVNILPIDFDSKTPGKSKPKKCGANWMCNIGNDEFCGASSHPTYTNQLDSSGKNGAPLRYCYKFQKIGSTNIKPIINGDKTELTGCNSHSDCFSTGPESFCFKRKDNRLRIAEDGRNYTIKDGVCATANVCDLTKYGSINASLTNMHTFCQTNDDCYGSASAKKHPDMEPVCVTVSNVTKMCCLEPKRCQFGTVVLPLNRCTSFENCNKGINEMLLPNETNINKWCDEKSKFCCQDDEFSRCLDRATSFVNEPKCNNSSLEMFSGTCPNDAGICKYGHCCPPLKRNDKDYFIIGKKHYITNVACRLSAPLPPQYNHAFCHPENKTIVIMGATNADGEAIPTGATNANEEANPKEGKNCTFNKECKKGEVCAKLVTGNHYCMFNPLKKKPMPLEPSKLWLNMAIGSGASGCVLLLASIICYMCYYQISVLKWIVRMLKGDTRGLEKITVRTFLRHLAIEQLREMAFNKESFLKRSGQAQQMILGALIENLAKVKGEPVVKNQHFEIPKWLQTYWDLQEWKELKKDRWLKLNGVEKRRMCKKIRLAEDELKENAYIELPVETFDWKFYVFEWRKRSKEEWKRIDEEKREEKRRKKRRKKFNETFYKINCD